MTRNKLDNLNCSMANALDLIGEWWTILILREAFFGTRRFDEFLTQLGIARNILTIRLKKLCDRGILKKVPIKAGAKRHEYRLTEMGHDLLPTLIALSQWGDKWLHGGNQAPVKYMDRENHKEIRKVNILSSDHRVLTAHDIYLMPGEGATEETRLRLNTLIEKMKNA